MTSSFIKQGKPFSEERTNQIISDFKRDGFALIPGVLEADEVKALRERTDHYFADPAADEGGYVEWTYRPAATVERFREPPPGERNTPFILRHINELDRIFCDVLVREPIIGLMESIFGPDPQQCGANVLYNDGTRAIDKWHMDDALFFPLPDDVPRHDPHIGLPILWLTVQIPLTDIESIENGPTQFVPGSHLSGRQPPEDGKAEFEGRSPESILCKAGDIYLHNPQCWHRGTPNTSGRPRYLMQQQYGPRWAFRRYNAYISHEMPAHVVEGANDRLIGVLGEHRFNAEDRYR